MTQFKLIPYLEECYYPESSQYQNIKFSFIKKIEDGVYEELQYPFLCRELVGVVLIAGTLGIDLIEIEGEDVNTNIDLDKLRICCTIPRIKSEVFMNSLGILLEEIEHKLNIPTSDMTKFFEVEIAGTSRSKIIIIANKKWIESPLTFSIYTFLLRLAMYGYATCLKESLELLLKEKIGNDYELIEKVGINAFISVIDNLDYIISENPLTNIETKEVQNVINRRTSIVSFENTFRSAEIPFSLNSLSYTSGIFSIINNSRMIQYYQPYSFIVKINEILKKL